MDIYIFELEYGQCYATQKKIRKKFRIGIKWMIAELNNFKENRIVILLSK